MAYNHGPGRYKSHARPHRRRTDRLFLMWVLVKITVEGVDNGLDVLWADNGGARLLHIHGIIWCLT